MLDRQALRDQLVRHEGLVLKPYRCTAGKLTIGVGRNIQDIGITKEEAMSLLDNDIDRVMGEMNKSLPWWTALDSVRQQALVNFVFNVGIGTALSFKNTMAALQRKDFEAAAKGFEGSKWYSQVGSRAVEIVRMIRKGQ